MLEDVRHVSGSLERFLIDRGETVVRLPPRLMANARRGVRERGKSDPIDALAIARAALREGIDTLPSARLAGTELEIQLLAMHRERLVDTRTRLINELRWQLHDLWPDWEIPKRILVHPAWQTKIAGRLGRAETGARVQIATASIRGGNRQLNHAFHMLALCKLLHDPRTAVYMAKQRKNGKTNREAIRSLKRHLVRRVYYLLHDPDRVPTTLCLT